MDETDDEQLTQLLRQWTDGDEQAGKQVLDALYRELRAQAGRAFQQERANHTLQPTALVNEAYLRLVQLHKIEWQDRRHFMRAAAKTMRRVLVDHARRRGSRKRGKAQPLESFEDELLGPVKVDRSLEDLDEALDRLAELDSQKAEIVMLRYFGGFSIEETAEMLEISRTQVVREWRFTKVWLRDFLGS